MPKVLLYSTEARSKIKKGVDTIADAVKITMGAKGRNVIMDSPYGFPIITKDGVTVARGVIVKDKFENQGVSLVKEACNKTNEEAGDGTTATAVLAQSIYNEAYKRVSAGMDAVSIKNEIEQDTQGLLEALKSIAKPVDSEETLEKITSISANNKEIGSFVAKVLWETGKDGVISVEESPENGIKIETVQGLQVNYGFVHPLMVTNPEKMEGVHENPKILITNRSVTSALDIVPVMNKMMQSGENKLVVVAPDISGSALSTMVLNAMQGKFHTLAIKIADPDLLSDIALVTGAKVFTKEDTRKFEAFTIEELGSAKKVVAGKGRTTFIDGNGDKSKLDELIKNLESSINSTNLLSERNAIEQRRVKLMGGIGLISVGGATQSEMQEKKQRVEDAVCAGKSALKAGYVVGGGTALLLADNDCNLGEVMKGSVKSCIKQIAVNAGKNGDVVYNKWDETGLGFNAATGQYEDLEAAGIIDPLLVIQCALEYGSSVACLLLSTECAITEEPEEIKK